MSWASIVSFTMGMALLSLSPGPGVATVIARTLGSGFWAGLATISGLVVGDLIFLAFAFIGLTTLAATAAPVFIFIKYAGAAYLVWLGYRTIRSAATPLHVRAVRSMQPWREAGMGLLVTLGNPKPILLSDPFVGCKGYFHIGDLHSASVLSCLPAPWLSPRSGQTRRMLAFGATNAPTF